MNTAVRCLALLGLLGLAGTAGAGVRINEGDRYPIARTTHEQYPISPAGRVEVHGIGGSVTVTAADAATVDFSYERRAATEADYACETLHYEHAAHSVRIWVERAHDTGCHTIHADDKLTLTVPRGAAVSLDAIGDSVNVTGVEGLLQLSSIGDSAVLSGVQQLDAKSIGDGLTMDVPKLGPAGITVRNVGDSVKMTLPAVLNARMRIDNVGDAIRGPGLHLESPNADYEAVLGTGGPTISIKNVGDSVVIRDGPSLKKPHASEY